ncbi:hypothetical protein P171DRAFT_173522 [Karstenula rhodostoma CBS 690.94]|uniref:Uncharacterized protein n=1 Tax=Karstenula rhodostoma CBS 690.94 TaxID=1392251 RepID=A0A9P4U676_9PLEO|nr:hypothetical protein P171DRAFT_173522 [Karstenula rhodostoma CBS 690.94]
MQLRYAISAPHLVHGFSVQTPPVIGGPPHHYRTEVSLVSLHDAFIEAQSHLILNTATDAQFPHGGITFRTDISTMVRKVRKVSCRGKGWLDVDDNLQFIFRCFSIAQTDLLRLFETLVSPIASTLMPLLVLRMFLVSLIRTTSLHTRVLSAQDVSYCGQARAPSAFNRVSACLP